MLPGFRFLLSAIVLCFSILVFGLGAAALLRAAHEQFASRPSWYPTPSTTFAQQGDPLARQGDSSGSVLALLEVDPDDNDAPREMPHDNAHEPALQPSASEPTAPVTETASGNVSQAQDLAALNAPEEPSPTAAKEAASNVPPAPEPDKPAHVEPEMSPDQGSAAIEHAAPVAASEPEARIASADETMSKAVEPSSAASEPINLPAVAPEPTAPRITAPEIAALGGPPAITDALLREKEASSEARAKAYRHIINNRLRAQRAAKARRRLAHRSSIVRRAVVQQQPRPAFTTSPATTATGPITENPYRF
jgi:hypothetical protein